MVMEECGKDARQVASETGLGVSTVKAYMVGDRNPTLFGLKAVCESTGASADWLLGFGGEQWR
jgi:hypothetical protein